MSPNSPASAFRYRAANRAGTIVEGVVQATTREQAVQVLRRQDLWPMDVEVVSESAVAPSRGWFGRGDGRRALSLWTRTVATLLESGAPLERALLIAEGHVTDRQVAAAVRTVRQQVVAGASFAEALRAQRAIVGPLAAAVVEAGEATGALDRAMETLAGYLDEEEALRAQIGAALLYPALMGAVATLGVLVLLLFVVPRFSALLTDLGGTLPLSTQVIVFVGAVITRGWWALAAAGVIAVMAMQRVLAQPTAQRRWHEWRLQLPVTGALERALATARFTRALGVLLQGGLSLMPALRLARSGVTNLVMQEGLVAAAEQVGRGESLARSHATLLSPLAVQLLGVGEDSGRLDVLALRAATAHEDEVRRSLRTLTALLEPAFILLFGAIVGFVALAMLQAIYAVNTGVQ